jgi:hypothetical protein
MMRESFKYAVAVSAIMAATTNSVSVAQDIVADDVAINLVESNAGIMVYASAYFTDFSPVTALDMVQRVPGFSLSNGDTSRRGLGDSFGNILLNGARPANKSLSLDTVLQRIPVADVERIELIQEAMPQYEMRGHARLVNVILREGAGNSGSWDTRLQLSAAGRLGPRGIISFSTTAGPTELTFGLDTGFSGNRVRRRYSSFDGNDVLTEIQHDNDQRNYSELRPSFSANWTINENSSLRFDTDGQIWEWHRTQTSFIDEPSGAGLVPLRFQQNQTENEGGYYLGSLTYALDLNDRVSLQTTALARREHWDDGPEAYETYDYITGFQGAIIVESGGEMDETAVRQTITYTPNADHTIEFGAETALNSRDTYLRLASDDGVTVTPIVLPVANTRVEETRSEVFANHTWTINDQLTLDSVLRYEFSEITQTGDANQTRSFSYPKPSFTLNWRRDDRNRLRLAARRDVAQLQFGKFASSVDVADNNSVLGNPNYVPQRTWTLEAEWERRFGDDGSFSLRVAQDWIEDLDGWVPITTATGVFDAPGNIGDGTNLRVTGNLTTPLDSLGLSNAVLVVFAEWYDMSIEDPLTGEDRKFDGYREWEFSFDFRQTFPEHQIAWGWDYHWLSPGEFFRASEYRTVDNTDGDLDLYIETTRWGGVTTRLGVDAVLNNGDDRERVFYNGSRALGVVSATEYRNESMGPTWYLRVRGTF